MVLYMVYLFRNTVNC